MRDDWTGGHIGPEDQRQCLGFAQPAGFLRRDEAVFHGRLFHLFGVDARAVVGHEEFDLVAVHRRHGEGYCGAGRFAQPIALFGRLNAVINAIAKEVNERVLHLLEYALVNLHLLAMDHQVSLLALIAAEVAHQFREERSQGDQRQHEQFFRVLHQIVHQLANDQAVLLRRPAKRRDFAFE